MEHVELALVYIVDDDDLLREQIAQCLRSSRRECRCYRTAEAMLDDAADVRPACLVTRLRLSVRSGIELHEQLQHSGLDIPTILYGEDFIIPDVVRAMRSGILHVLEKPLDFNQLRAVVDETLERHCSEWRALRDWRARMSLLSPREKEVAGLILGGRSTKEIGSYLSITSSTVEKHRLRLFSKLRVDSAAELILEAGRAKRSCSISNARFDGAAK